MANHPNRQRAATARQIARSEISQPYITAANTHTHTWGLSTRCPGEDGARRFRTESNVGTYREAVAARREWIEQRVAELMAEQ